MKRFKLVIFFILFLILMLILYCFYMINVDAAFNNVKEDIYNSKILEAHIGKVKKVKYNNFLQWISKVKDEKCIKLKVITTDNKKYNICALVEEKNNKFQNTGFILNNDIIYGNVTKEEAKGFVGEWIADGTQTRVLVKILEDGTEVFADDYSKPYILNIKDGDTYYINFNNKNREEKGTYSFSHNEIFFIPDSSLRPRWHCNLEDNRKLTNCMYASVFSKVE